MTEKQKELLRNLVPIFTLLILVFGIAAYEPGFLRPANLITVTADTMTLFLMASGATLVIMLGSIDLSIQAIASMTSCIVAAMLPIFGGTALLFALAAGATAGVLSGLVVNYLRIPSFVATLAIGGIMTSVAFWASDERSIYISDADKSAWLNWATGTTGGMDNEVLVGLAVLAGLSAILSLTRFGRLVRAVGSQERAVVASGINVNRVKFLAFVISGFMAGLAGLVMAARLGSGSPTLASEFLLPAIACIIVGGTAITGGVGSIWKTFVGALIIAVVRIGMTFVGVTVFAQQIVFGLVLVLAVAMTIDRTKVAVVK
ncbi:MAG: ABC transporter permease [Rhodobacteraceae bacterium]|nr:ABC transporter permease [Paracoccaceae bacterium]